MCLLDKKDSNGTSKRSHLKQAAFAIANRDGITEEEAWEDIISSEAKKDSTADFSDDIPEAGTDLWLCFWDLFNTGGVTWENVYYYAKVMDIHFTGEEITILQKMNSVANEVKNS